MILYYARLVAASMAAVTCNLFLLVLYEWPFNQKRIVVFVYKN